MQFLGPESASRVKKTRHDDAGLAIPGSSGDRAVAVALGSNLGDRRDHLYFGISKLQQILTNVTVSDFIETVPQSPSKGTERMFLNAAAVGRSAESPATLLSRLRAVEYASGRERPYPGAARTLDLDLILVGDIVLSKSELIVPHPRFREREFVLAPLARVAPDLVDPVTGLTIQALLNRLNPKNLAWRLFEPQRLYRIKLGGLSSRIETEKDTGGGSEPDGE